MKPLLRFLAFGAALFAAVRWMTPSTPSFRYPRASPVALTDEARLLAAARERGIWDDDVVVQRRLLESARSVELAEADAYRSAVFLRLDRGDPIIARRLVQQMRLQLESEARRMEPTEADLREYLAAHTDRFAVPERVRVTHVFFSYARRGEQAERDATACRVGTAHQPGLADPDGAVGDPSLWPAELPLQTAAELEKVFGSAATAIFASPLRAWTGPHRSTLGYHLVRVIERVPAAVPAFETVRTAVRLALLNEHAEEHVRRAIAALR